MEKENATYQASLPVQRHGHYLQKVEIDLHRRLDRTHMRDVDISSAAEHLDGSQHAHVRAFATHPINIATNEAEVRSHDPALVRVLLHRRVYPAAGLNVTSSIVKNILVVRRLTLHRDDVRDDRDLRPNPISARVTRIWATHTPARSPYRLESNLRRDASGSLHGVGEW